MNELQFEQAKELGERALVLEPDNLKTLDVLSGLLLEMGNAARAAQVSSWKLAPSYAERATSTMRNDIVLVTCCLNTETRQLLTLGWLCMCFCWLPLTAITEDGRA